MNLDNQLLVKDEISGKTCMCGKVAEVADFVERVARYTPSEVELKAMDYVFNQALPLPAEMPEHRRRFLLALDKLGCLHEWDEDVAPLEGMRFVGIVFRGAFGNRPAPVAQFYLGDPAAPITLHVSRYSSTDSNAYTFVQNLWAQQLDHLSDDGIPGVDIDLVPYESSEKSPISENDFGTYTLHIGEEKFPVIGVKQISEVLEAYLGKYISRSLRSVLIELFTHLNTFPPKVVSGPAVSLFVDRRKHIYVGGDGTNNTRRLLYAGKLFPQFFTGTSGNVFMLRIGAFETERFNILLTRN